MLFIEAERMANCLYDPQDCESERTVIISELQGGENDPDHLLDIEVTATAFKAHPYRHPTIGWLSDLQSITRDDLYGYYRRYYAPNNAALVIVGDVDSDEALRRADKQFGSIGPGKPPERVRTTEPTQLGERRVRLAREGTAAYLKLVYHAPAAEDPDFCPMLALDAVLTGAKGLNLWSSFRGIPPQRNARLYRTLVEGRLASSVSGAFVATEHPFLYAVSVTATDGVALAELEQAALADLDRLRSDGVGDIEFDRAKRQLRARLVFENDSVTNIAHQLGFFQTVSAVDLYTSLPARVGAVTTEEVTDAARKYLVPSNRTIGWFEPL